MKPLIIAFCFLVSACEKTPPPTVMAEETNFIGRQEISLQCSFTGICMKFDPFKMETSFGLSASCPGHYTANADIYETVKRMSDETVRKSSEQENITLTSSCR